MVSLTALRTLIETERARFGVPGVAVAVIARGEVILQQGFGVRDLAMGTRVTEDTVFPIASDSKCFTAAALCILADEDLIDLDVPVREYIPWFRMHDLIATELTTCRDLLSHRTGLSRHDLVWYGDVHIGREKLVRALRHLPLSLQPRQGWQYNNLGYSAAGYLAEVVTGSSWEAVIRSRLLYPLAMSDTGFDARQASKGNFATPYREVEGELLAQVLPSQHWDGPPGGMVSTVKDLSKWALARLGHQVHGAERVLSDVALGALHAPTALTGKELLLPGRHSLGYGLGCQLEVYRGNVVIRHGGNLIGYSSDVSVSPDLDAAVVVLTNRHHSELPESLTLAIYDLIAERSPLPCGQVFYERMTTALQGQRESQAVRASRASGRAPTRPLAQFAGDYDHPGYGRLMLRYDAGAGGLSADFHGLGDRLHLRHRDGDAFDLVLPEFEAEYPMTFTHSVDGDIAGVVIPLEPLVPPIEFVKQTPPMQPGLLISAPGTYSNGTWQVVVTATGRRLSLTSSETGLMRLVPRGGAVFGVEGKPALRVEFEADRLLVEPIGVFRRATEG